jgi:cellulose synthase/poly-beta-1,6-N-acetylglucosamine synthase-like glycosyltransferase
LEGAIEGQREDFREGHPASSRDMLGSLSHGSARSPLSSFPPGTAPLSHVKGKVRSAGSSSGAYRPSCTVVICTRNRPEFLDQCLAAVAKLDYGRFEVLVVDNAPSDEHTREVATRWRAGYVVEPVVGLSRARNHGALVCRSEIVAYLDDDAVPERGWLSALVREFRDQRVMAATGQARPLTVNTEAERLFASMGGFDHGEERRVVDRRVRGWFELANFGGLGDGYNMAFRRRVFETWPGFHESLGRGAALIAGEEHHAFFSLIDRGHRVVYTPRAVIRHPYPRTVEELQRRHLSQLSEATAYITFMFVEEPAYRWAIVKYVLGAAFGTRRTWRCRGARKGPQLAGPWATLAARLGGPLLYMRSALRQPESREAAISTEVPSATDHS